MRVVFCLWPNAAHLYPLVPLAWALQASGHEVRVASHHALREKTVAVGLPAVSVGDPDMVPMGPGNPYPEERDLMASLTSALAPGRDERDPWDVFTHFMLPSIWDFSPMGRDDDGRFRAVDDLVDFARDWKPDLVVWDPCFPIGAVAAAASGAAHARMLWGQDYFGWSRSLFGSRNAAGTATEFEEPLSASVRPSAERHGVEVDEELLLGHWTLDPLPEALRLPTDTLTVPVRWVPYAGQTPVPEWLRANAGRPRVALSLGLSQRMYLKGGWGHVPDLLDALGGLDVDVVATLDATQLENARVPANVRTVDYLPLNQLLPTCEALIHHGGVGTFAAAASLGVPQLITDSDDEHGVVSAPGEGMEASKHVESSITAGYVTSRNAGLRLDHRTETVEDIRENLRRVLKDPLFRRGADRVRGEVLAAPAPSSVVPVLEELTALHKGTS
ncbi:glycosyl transferase [Nocardiopsis sp. TSRI0078]|uniref:nucleotide disphospho-sugar-binding domain-containing protein n=1 Tax=unclassified Nocardiopsis TaxID=2649073 RepID=UPI00093C058B|nr:nucleotide disphospho-sugar-binding domain-containing protein [Nocardiopsis sp. TSRI0078]OKI23467.1 glycosyl transferase [Nocardiopsis sp. TSRI0078]